MKFKFIILAVVYSIPMYAMERANPVLHHPCERQVSVCEALLQNKGFQLMDSDNSLSYSHFQNPEIYYQSTPQGIYDDLQTVSVFSQTLTGFDLSLYKNLSFTILQSFVNVYKMTAKEAVTSLPVVNKIFLASARYARLANLLKYPDETAFASQELENSVPEEGKKFFCARFKLLKALKYEPSLQVAQTLTELASTENSIKPVNEMIETALKNLLEEASRNPNPSSCPVS